MTAHRATSAALLLVICAACRNRERAPYDFERMRQQQRYDLWSRSGVFPNGATMQLPPAGTIAREATIGPAPVATGRAGTTFVAAVPVPVTPALLERGASRFAIYCAACHGAAGFGGSLVASNMVRKRPPSLRSDSARRLPPGYLFDVMTHGKGRMPPYDWALSPGDRWAVAAYVQQLQRRPTLSAAAYYDSTYAVFLHSVDSANAAQHRQPAGLSAPGSTP